MKQRVTVLGSTGSVGTNTLDVIARHPDRFEVFARHSERGLRYVSFDQREVLKGNVVICRDALNRRRRLVDEPRFDEQEHLRVGASKFGHQALGDEAGEAGHEDRACKIHLLNTNS